jgi:hypothetical protein
MTDHTNPPSANSSDDLLLRRYAEANTLDDARPSPTVRKAVLAQARVQAAAQAQALHIAAQATSHRSARPAANDSAWGLRALGSLAVLGLVGLLALQFDRGSPDERELALGRPSVSTAQKPAAPVRAEAPTPALEDAVTTALSTPEPTSTGDMAERSALAKTAPAEARPAPPPVAPQPKAALPAPAPPANAAAPPAAAARARTLPQQADAPMARRPASGAAADIADSAPLAAVPAPSAFPASPAMQTPAANKMSGAPAAPPVPAASHSAQERLARAPTRPPATSASIDNESATPSGAEPAMQAKQPSAPDATAFGRSREAAPGGSAASSDASAERLSEAPALSPDNALLAAATRGWLQGAREALARGANADHARQPDGRTALMLAAQRGDAAMVRLLIDSGADIQRLDRDGLSAADWARRAGQTGVLPLLLPPPSR